MHRSHPAVIACALLLCCALGIAAPSHASKFGNPKMYVLTARIAPPYSPTFNLNTAVSAWPSLLEPITLTERQKDPQGQILLVFLPDAFDTLVNISGAIARTNGVYGSSALIEDIFVSDYVGMFSYSQLVQSFVKDSAGAYCTFHVGVSFEPAVYARAVALDDVRSEFAMDVDASSHGASIFHFHQDAGVRSWANSLGETTSTEQVDGPMSYIESHPAPANHDELLTFFPYLGTIDLSGVSVGDTFTVVFKCMTQTSFIPAEYPRGFAQTIDPNGEGGISIEVAGVHATDAPHAPELGVGPDAAATLASLSPVRPNPGTGAVSFSLEVPRDGKYAVEVYDLAGRRLARLADGPLSAGTHAFTWNATDERGRDVPAGVYFVRASGPEFAQVRRVVQLAGR